MYPLLMDHLQPGDLRNILGTQDLSALLGRPVETLRYWRWRGEGPRSYKLGRRVVYDLADVKAWIAEQKAATTRGAA